MQRTETMRLLVSTKKLTDKTKSSKNVLSLELAGVVLVQCNVIGNQYQQILRHCILLCPKSLMLNQEI